MRRTFLFVLMISLLLSAGCTRGREDEETLSAIQQQLRETASLTAQAEVCTEDSRFKLSCVSDGGCFTVTVKEPEIIAGVTATVSGSEFEIGYDEVFISAGALNSDGLNPVSALPCIAVTLRDGSATELWRETVFDTECICARFQVSDESRLTVWLEPQLQAPLYAELDNGGKVVLSCTFDTWIRG